MATLLQQSENLKKLDEKTIETQIFKALKEAEVAVIKANIEQLDKGDDSEGNQVGVYKKATEMIAEFDPTPNKPKDFGKPFNFDWTGEFLKGFTLSVSGTLDNDPGIRPQARIMDGSRAEWSCDNSELPVFDTYPPTPE